MLLEAHKIFANLSWILLIVILISRPLAEIVGNKILFRFLRYRKRMGIACGLAAISHVVFFLIGSGLLGVYFSDPMFWSPNTFFGWGSLALVAMFFPLLTSNNFSLRYFGRHWKKIQRLAYLVFVATAVHVAMVKNDWLTVVAPTTVWLLLWVWAEIKRVKKNSANNIEKYC